MSILDSVARGADLKHFNEKKSLKTILTLKRLIKILRLALYVKQFGK